MKNTTSCSQTGATAIIKLFLNQYLQSPHYDEHFQGADDIQAMVVIDVEIKRMNDE